jgi:hypothetical protein
MAHMPRFFQILLSVMAALFGVQSSSNHARDFSSGHAWPYMLLGLAVMVLFVVFVIFLVTWALSLAGA